MGKKHSNRAKHQHGPNHDKEPAHTRGVEASMLYTVRIQPDPKDENRYADEKKDRTDQLEISRGQLASARCLNVISGIGGGIAFLALVAFCYNALLIQRQLCVMRQQLAQTKADERAWIGIERNAAIKATPEKLTIQYMIKNVGHSEAAVALDAKIIRNDEPWHDRLLEFREGKLRDAKGHSLPGKRWGKGGWTVIPEFPMQYDWVIPRQKSFPVTLVGCVLYAPLPDSELPDTTCFVSTISQTKTGFLVETLPAENTTEYQNPN